MSTCKWRALLRASAGHANRDLKYGAALNHLPSARFAANVAWLDGAAGPLARDS